MLPTFVIGLREGLEAALIVGIIAAFLRQRGRTDLLRLVWLGVGVAVLLCLGIGVALKVVSAELPQREQERLETVVALVAVAMVTYMIVWMRGHAHELRRDLESATLAALAAGGGALVGMAFLAVLREGFETAVFLLAAFNESASPVASGAGALIGIALASALGYGIYRGGVRLDLGRFFRVTGALLVLVAAGLVMSAAHTAHAAGWLNVGQQATVDLSWLVRPGTVTSSLVTGMLGLQPKPVRAEVIAWLLYLVPVGLYVLWPPGRRVPARALLLGGGAGAAGCALAAILLLVLAPASPSPAPLTQRLPTRATIDGVLAVTATGDAGTLVATRAGSGWRVTRGAGPARLATPDGTEVHAGRVAALFTSRQDASVPAGLPQTLRLARAIESNDGRLPLGVNVRTEPDPVPVTYAATITLRLWVDRSTGRVVDADDRTDVLATARFTRGPFVLATPVVTARSAVAPSARDAAAAAGREADAEADRRLAMRRGGIAAAVVAGLALLLAAGALASGRAPFRRPPESRPPETSPAAPPPCG